MSCKPLWLFSYDITCPKRLKRVYRLCCSLGWPLQRSVFVIALWPEERKRVVTQLEHLLCFSEDHLLVIPFVPSKNSFHQGPDSIGMVLHDDERLRGFVR